MRMNENDIPEEPARGNGFFKKFIQTMNYLQTRGIIFAVTIILTGIAAFKNGPLKTKKPDPPTIFFHPPSLVTDFYDGNYEQLISLVSEKDVSLIYYYAPWDATSIQTRNEIETVAKFYHNEVFFSAINCWWPQGSCRKRFVPVFQYPAIVVNVHDVGGVTYEGPLLSTYIISFLDAVLNPVIPLHNAGELVDLFTKHEAVLAVFFEFKNGFYPRGYTQFYNAALRALVRDPHRQICFAAVTNRYDASNLQMKSEVQLFMWNSTRVYSAKLLNIHNISSWAYSILSSVTSWISPPGTKSYLMSDVLEKSATLLLFTPRNSVLELSPYYDLLKEVALDYNNCNRTNFIASIIHRLVLKRHTLQEELSRTLKRCHLNDTRRPTDVCNLRPDACDMTCCQPWHFVLRQQQQLKQQQRCLCRACLHNVVQSVQEMRFTECENTLKLVLQNFDVQNLGTPRTECSDVEASLPVKFGPYRHISFECESEQLSFEKPQPAPTSSEYASLKDDLIVIMMQNNEKRMCHRLRHALNYSELNFPSFPNYSDPSSWTVNFTGLACSTPKMLSFVAMDSVVFHSFAENIGVDVSKMHHQTSAVIIDSIDENQFFMEKIVTKKNLVDFIKNFTHGSLTRHARKPVRKMGDNCGKDDQANFCIDELTTESFFDVVLGKEDVVLLYYTTWCGFCQAIFHVYLNVAYHFSNIQGIKFARINGEENDLPWEYTADKYPTILFFPAKRKSDSILFPHQLQISFQNLLHFVLLHSQPSVRTRAATELCDRHCVTRNVAMTARELRRLRRELRTLIANLQFVRAVVTGSSKLSHSSVNTRYLRSVHLASIVERVRKRRSELQDAFRLQFVLKMRLNEFAKERNETVKVERGNVKEELKKDEL